MDWIGCFEGREEREYLIFVCLIIPFLLCPAFATPCPESLMTMRFGGLEGCFWPSLPSFFSVTTV